MSDRKRFMVCTTDEGGELYSDVVTLEAFRSQLSLSMSQLRRAQPPHGIPKEMLDEWEARDAEILRWMEGCLVGDYNVTNGMRTVVRLKDAS